MSDKALNSYHIEEDYCGVVSVVIGYMIVAISVLGYPTHGVS